MVIRISLKCEYGTITWRKVTTVGEMTNFYYVIILFYFFWGGGGGGALINSVNNKTIPE